jgi:hypothetical protein
VSTAAVRKLFLLFALALPSIPAAAVTIDRVAAVVDRQVLTVSEISQMVEIRFFPRLGPSDDEHRREVLEALIAQALRFRDVERFGAQDIAADVIEARVQEITARFPTPVDFTAALARAELTLDEVRALAKRQLQVEAYIQERFAPLIFVSSEDIETYYAGAFSAARRDRGLPIPALETVRDEVRTAVRSTRLEDEIAKWTTQLRARANVDVYAWR